MASRLLFAAVLPLLALLGAAPAGAQQPSAWEPRGVGGGGALFQPALSPHRPGEMHVACDMSQLFRTDDFGLSWSVLDFRVLGGNRETRVWYTPDPAVLYTIDRATRNLVDLYSPVKSLDGGRTWQPLPGLGPFFEAWDMAVDPHDADRVFVVDYGDLYGSQNGGATFSASLFSDASGAGLRIAGIFTDGDLVLIGSNAGLLVSADGGRTFQLNPGLTGIDFGAEAMTGFAGSRDPATGAIRLLCVTHATGDVYLGMYGCEHWGYVSVYTLDWPSTAWSQRTTGLRAGDHPFFAGMSDGDLETMWISGGTDAGEPLVARSTNGGLSWTDSFRCAGNANIATGWSGQGGDRGWGYGECAMGFGVSPTDPLRAAITDYGFVHVTDDGGATWRQAYVDPATQHPAGANTPRRSAYASVGIEDTTSWYLHWVDASTIIACYSDIRGTRSEDGGATWGFDYAGHAANSMYHVVQQPPSRGGRLFAATGSVHDMYQSTRLGDGILDGGDGSVLFSDDGGNQWQLMHDFNDVVVWLALHPTQPDTLYASVVNSAAGDIHVTRNASAGAGSTWTRLASPPRTQGHPFNIRVLTDGALVASYSGRRDGGGAFTASSGVFVSTDDGQTWLDRSDAGMRYWTKDVIVDPHDPTESTWYAGVFSGWGGPPNGLGGLYRTTNRGTAWTRILDLDRVTSITIDPAAADAAWVTTETDGLWHTADLTAAAPTFAADPAYPFRQPERVFHDPFLAGGIWVTSFGNGLRLGIEGGTVARDLRRATLPGLSFVAPPLSTVLPLDAADVIVTAVVTGDLDPDPGIVGDPARPLAFYDVDAAVTLRLSLTPARRIRVDF